MELLNGFIKDGWGKARTTSSDSDLEMPYAFVPPSIKGDFRTLYYWDTYFTNVGLILDNHAEWALENVNNLLYALSHFNCVPNYTRKNGADYCSQPPLLSLMIKDIYEQTRDDEWMVIAVEGLEKEYSFWMNKRITAIGLNQYGCNANEKEKLKSYFEYITTRLEFPSTLTEEEKINMAKNFVAEAESGEDFTPRYASHNALDYVQIDLNSHLYGVEDFLCSYFKDKNKEKSLYYENQKSRRVALIEKYCYDEQSGLYFDYNFVKQAKSNRICVACFLPYFYGYAKDGRGLDTLFQKLKTKGGIVSCEDTGVYTCQWGYPNIWAPHQYFAYVALKNYGRTENAKLLRDCYVGLLSKVFNETGALWERYDENGNATDLEYPTQQMLGWTAGVFRYFYENK